MSQISETEKKKYGTIQNRDWHKKNIIVFLDHELYPDEVLINNILILTKKEIDELNAKTQKRLKQYNNNVKPIGWAGFTEKNKKV